MTITYVKDILPMKKVLAIVLIVAGLSIFISKNIFIGLIMLLIGINLIAAEGSEIDLVNKKYRNIKSIFGLKAGKWKALPDFEYLSVFKTNENTAVSAYGAEIGRFKSEIILLNAFYPRNKHITFYKTSDIEDAFRVAEHFRLALLIDILDATGPEKHWL